MDHSSNLLNKNFWVLDLDFAQKGRVLSSLCFFSETLVLIGYNLLYFAGYVLDLPLEHRLSQDFFWSFNSIYALIIAVNFIHLSYFPYVQKRKSLHDLYMYISVIIYTATHGVLCHMLGEGSVNTGILLTGAPIVGWILFNNKAVILGVLTGAVITGGTYILTLTGTLTYAPIVAQSPNIFANGSYTAVLVITLWPHVVLILMLAYKSIDNWKNRETKTKLLASLDPLTQIDNRRQFDENLTNSIHDSLEADTPVGLIMFDVDHFKKINDSFGHPAGDNLLSNIVKRINKNLKEDHQLARYGGDEFGLILPQAGPSTTLEVAERCRMVIEGTPFYFDGESVYITASFGVSTFLPSSKEEHIDVSYEAQQLIEDADQALLESKRMGRNRVTSHS